MIFEGIHTMRFRRGAIVLDAEMDSGVPLADGDICTLSWGEIVVIL